MTETPQSRPDAGTPASDAFYLPADHSRQARLWLPWPDDNPYLQAGIISIARAAAIFQPVALVVNPGMERAALAACGTSVITDTFVLPHVSARLRDTGPTFLVDGKGGSAAVDWRFNAWGGRRESTDTELAHAILGAAEVRRFRAPLTLEGSSFVGDGRGTLLALSPAVFDPARNASLTQLEAFGIFQQWLGVARVIWVDSAHPADVLHTDLRLIASFVTAGLVAVTRESAVCAALVRARDAQGKNLELLRLPAPPQAERHALSYTSFLPINGGLLIPSFDADSDARAADMLAEVFPGRTMTLVPAADLAAFGVSLTSLVLPHPARLLERERATILPRSAWSQPTPDAEAIIQKYIDMADKQP
jgi:agmatine deiminase